MPAPTLNLRSRLFLFIFLAIFIACKIPYMHYAYYWDECWPYATAITDMYHHSISLLPGAMDPNISRGHPLFFHAMGATWMHIFGPSHVSMHSFALLISVLFLVALYETGLRLFNMRVAILAVSLVGLQEIFFVQSAMVLFDMLVAFLCFLSIVFYVRERYLLTTLCLSMLFFTKESGLIAGFIIGLDALASLFRKDIEWKKRIYRLLCIGVPCILIASFFLLQKHIRGWYVFPLYSDTIQNDWGKFWYSFRMSVVHEQFHDQLRFYDLLILLALAVTAAVKQKSVRLLSVLLPAICVYYFIDDMRAGRLLPPVPFFIVFLLSIFFVLYTYADKRYFPQLCQRRLIILSGSFIVCFLLFSNISYFSGRYLLASVVPMLFLVAVFMDKLAELSYRWLFYPAVTGIFVVAFFVFKDSNGHSDVSIGAFDGIAVQQDVVNYLEQHQVYDKTIATASYLQMVHLNDPGTGFLHSNKIFKVNYEFKDADYFIFDNIEEDARYQRIRNDTAYRQVFHVENRTSWAEIYKRK
jgi:4-amino-4-deoxy-L-arabinose transferase-like glycosyltransferase